MAKETLKTRNLSNIPLLIYFLRSQTDNKIIIKQIGKKKHKTEHLPNMSTIKPIKYENKLKIQTEAIIHNQLKCTNQQLKMTD